MYATKIVNIDANEKIFLTKPRPAYDETNKQQPLYPLSLQHEETSDFQIAAAFYYLLATHRRYLLDTIPQYVDQYLRPLYDALYQIMGAESFQKNMEKGLIEVAPLAYMRGRTLDNAFIILDEAQNTTPAQMKMFLTRIGFGSKAVITGDATQKDLAPGTASGLDVALKVLKKVDEIGICELTSKDVVRHPVVQKIVKAYEDYENRSKSASKRKQETRQR